MSRPILDSTADEPMWKNTDMQSGEVRIIPELKVTNNRIEKVLKCKEWGRTGRNKVQLPLISTRTSQAEEVSGIICTQH